MEPVKIKKSAKINLDVPYIEPEIPKLISQLHQNLAQQYVDKENELIQEVLLNHAVPKIKLPITKGKLKRRGISLVIFQGEGGLMMGTPNHTTQVLQRGKPIGQPFKIIIDYNLNNGWSNNNR